MRGVGTRGYRDCAVSQSRSQFPPQCAGIAPPNLLHDCHEVSPRAVATGASGGIQLVHEAELPLVEFVEVRLALGEEPMNARIGERLEEVLHQHILGGQWDVAN